MAGSDPLAVRRSLRHAAIPRWVLGIIVLCCLFEAALTLCDLVGLRFTIYVTQQQGFFPFFTSQRLGIPVRQVVNGLFGFWSEQAHAWRGLYPGQPALMFLTYGLLHGGLLHLGMNMLSLAALARELGPLIGNLRMAVIYLVSQLAAAAMFALMAPTSGPMVGASGAIFGLAGALVGFAAVTGWRRRRPLGPLWKGVALMMVLNVALTVLMPSIAWEAHLGGTLAGLVMGAVIAMTRTPRTSVL